MSQIKATDRHENVGSEGTEFSVSSQRGMKRRYSTIVRAANDEGIIQAWDARELFADPRHHTTMSLARALRLAGFDLEVA